MSGKNQGIAIALKLRFVNRSDTYAVQQKDNSYRRIDKALTENLILQHLEGKITVGPYQLDPTNNHVKWTCFDIDPERIPEPKKVASKICEYASKIFGEKAVLLEASRHPDESYHIWILFDPSIPAKVAKLLAQKILKAAKLEKVDIEIFPKQDKILEDGFGNLVKLPLGIHQKYRKRSLFLDQRTFEPLSNNYILNLQGYSIPKDKIQKMIKKIDKVQIPSFPMQETPSTDRIPECIQKLLEGTQEGDRNDTGIRLASYWLNFCKIPANKIWGLLEQWNSGNTPLLDKNELQSIIKSATKGGYNYGCNDSFLKSLCPGKKDCSLFKPKNKKSENKKEKQDITQKPFVELPNQILCEQAYDGNKVFYLVYSHKTAKVEKLQQVKDGSTVYTPIDNEEVRHGLVLLPSAVQDFEDEKQLLKDIEVFLNRWHEAPDEESRKLDVYYVLLTYIKDLVPQIPYRRILASWGKGKSAWLETLGWISYRGTVLAGSDTDKSIVRRMNLWQGTAIIDEADFGNSTLYSFIIKILNVGYDQKTGFYQRCDDNDPKKTITYNVYGPKLLATRSRYKDQALESRCLTTIGRENTKPVSLFRMNKFKQEAQVLRNKLIGWRFKNYYRIKEETTKLEDPNIVKEVYGEDSKISSRIKQIVLPLWLVGGKQIRAGIKEFTVQFDEKLKAEDPDYALELQAKDAVNAILKENSGMALDGESLNEMNVLMEAPSEPQKLKIELSKISKKILEQQGYGEIQRKDKISISKRLKNIFELRLGFPVTIGRSRSRIVTIPSVWISNDSSEEPLTKEHSTDSDIHHPCPPPPNR